VATLTIADDNFSSPEYPTDLSPLLNNPNYTSIEQQGFIAVFDLTLATSTIDENGTIHKRGSRDQCAEDNCIRIYDAIINRCK
jgi:hypothetical protein